MGQSIAPKVIRWEEQATPRESVLRDRLAQEKLRAGGWENGPNYYYPEHTHVYHKVLYVVRGSITFGLPDLDQELTLNAGDRLELPPNTRHIARVGPKGVECLEAYRY